MLGSHDLGVSKRKECRFRWSFWIPAILCRLVLLTIYKNTCHLLHFIVDEWWSWEIFSFTPYFDSNFESSMSENPRHVILIDMQLRLSISNRIIAGLLLWFMILYLHYAECSPWLHGCTAFTCCILWYGYYVWIFALNLVERKDRAGWRHVYVQWRSQRWRAPGWRIALHHVWTAYHRTDLVNQFLCIYFAF